MITSTLLFCPSLLRRPAPWPSSTLLRHESSARILRRLQHRWNLLGYLVRILRFQLGCTTWRRLGQSTRQMQFIQQRKPAAVEQPRPSARTRPELRRRCFATRLLVRNLRFARLCNRDDRPGLGKGRCVNSGFLFRAYLSSCFSPTSCCCFGAI